MDKKKLKDRKNIYHVAHAVACTEIFKRILFTLVSKKTFR